MIHIEGVDLEGTNLPEKQRVQFKRNLDGTTYRITRHEMQVANLYSPNDRCKIASVMFRVLVHDALGKLLVDHSNYESDRPFELEGTYFQRDPENRGVLQFAPFDDITFK